MSTNKKSTELKKQNKNMEINMSTLSTAQKQMCLKLLAQSNINFEEAKNQNCFEAELRIDPAKLTSEFTAQKEIQPKLSPIKKRQPGTNPVNMKENHHTIANLKSKHQKVKQKSNTAKQVVHPIYTNSKKLLSKTIKLNNLSEMQRLHPYLELYVYPKKMSFQTLIELIEQIYDTYWNCEIHGNQNRRKQTRTNETNIKQQSKINKNLIKNKRTISQNIAQQAKDCKKRSFCEWVYENFITIQKEKMKVEQLLVNFIESLNHFSFKHIGIQMFYNFFSGVYSLDTLNYFLVIRALLEQVQGEKIIDKVSSYASKAGVLYKMKLNPYNKFIEQEKVLDFLEVCCQGSANSANPDEAVDKVFQQMTEQMFFDQKKKKNFIHFFQMSEILLKEFLKVETVNSTNLELSMTQQNSSLNDFLFKSQMDLIDNGDHDLKEEMELTFEVRQAEDASECGRMDSQDDLDGYLPNVEIQLSSSQEQKKQSFEQTLRYQAFTKFNVIRRSFSSLQQASPQTLESQYILQTLIESITKGEKKKWIELVKGREGGVERQLQQLNFIQKLQREYQLLRQSSIISNSFVKRMMTASYLREAIVAEAGITIANL